MMPVESIFLAGILLFLTLLALGLAAWVSRERGRMVLLIAASVFLVLAGPKISLPSGGGLPSFSWHINEDLQRVFLREGGGKTFTVESFRFITFNASDLTFLILIMAFFMRIRASGISPLLLLSRRHLSATTALVLIVCSSFLVNLLDLPSITASAIALAKVLLVLGAFVVSLEIVERKDLFPILAAGVAGAVILMASGPIDTFSQILAGPKLLRASGLFDQPYQLAFFGTAVFSYSSVVLFGDADIRFRAVAAPLALVSFAVVLFSAVATYIGALVAILLLLPLLVKRPIIYPFLLVIFPLALIASPGETLERADIFFRALLFMPDQPGTMNTRLYLWSRITEAVSASPLLGVGPMRFSNVDSHYLMVLGSYGILGLTAFLLLVLGIAKSGISTLLFERDPVSRLILSGWLLFFIAALIGGISFETLWAGRTASFFWLATGTSIALARPASEPANGRFA